jgi:hypothetical protein
LLFSPACELSAKSLPDSTLCQPDVSFLNWPAGTKFFSGLWKTRGEAGGERQRTAAEDLLLALLLKIYAIIARWVIDST